MTRPDRSGLTPASHNQVPFTGQVGNPEVILGRIPSLSFWARCLSAKPQIFRPSKLPPLSILYVVLAGAFRVGFFAHLFRGLLRTAVEGGGSTLQNFR